MKNRGDVPAAFRRVLASELPRTFASTKLAAWYADGKRPSVGRTGF